MSQKIIFAYWASWSRHRQGKGKYHPSNIDPFLCTHLAYALFGITEEYTITSLDIWLDINLNTIESVVALKENNSDLKVLATVGGWNEGSTKYSAMASSSENRATFIKSVVDFLIKYKFDGLDFDWQFPGQRGGSAEDVINYIILLRELNEVLKPHNFLLTVAVLGTSVSSLTDESYNIADMAKYVDYINIRTYGYHTPYNNILGHNSPLHGSDQYSVSKSINYWISKGAPAQKILMGIPFYGHTYKVSNCTEISPYSPSCGAGNKGPYTGEAGFMGYNEIRESFNTWTHVWDASARVPYAYSNDQWLSFDNQPSIKEKVDFVNYHNLAGVNIWSIDTDDFHGISGQRNPLLHTINNELHK